MLCLHLFTAVEKGQVSRGYGVWNLVTAAVYLNVPWPLMNDHCRIVIWVSGCCLCPFTPHSHRHALGVSSAPRKVIVSGIVSSKPLLHSAFVLTSYIHYMVWTTWCDGARETLSWWMRMGPGAHPVPGWHHAASLQRRLLLTS